MIKAILFDLDGTLLQSLNVWEKVDDLFLEKRGIEMTDDYHQALLNMRFSEAAVYTIERYHLNESPQAIMDEWMKMAKDMYHYQVQLKDGVKEMLKQLNQEGYTLGILTSCHQELFEPCLKRHGIWKYFSYIFEANPLQLSKTQKEIYEYALNKMKIAPNECLFIDDVYASLKCAKDIGIAIIAINDPSSFHSDIYTLTPHIFSDFTDPQAFLDVITLSKKLELLREIAKAFNHQHITWALGASLLLYLKGVSSSFHDLDLLVSYEDVEKVKDILSHLGQLQYSPHNDMYQTKVFLEYKIDGIDVDVMASFAIVFEDKVFDCSLTKEQIVEYYNLDDIKIPLQSLELWADYYQLMGRKKKVEMIETFLSKNEKN